MKKLILFLFSAVLLIGCQNSPVSTGSITFDNLLANTDSVVSVKYPNATLFEAQTVLKRNSENEFTDTIIPTATKIIYSLSGSTNRTLMVSFDSIGTPTFTTDPSPWLEDVVIKDSLIGLKSAIDSLYKADIVKPRSNYMTLRRPLYPGITEPQYMFGDPTYFVSVGAKSGRVK